MKFSYAFSSLLVVAVAPTVLASSICSSGTLGTHYYQVMQYPKGTMTWTQAKNEAETLPAPANCYDAYGAPAQGTLVSIASSTESSHVVSLLYDPGCGTTHDAWIGLTDVATEGTFVWIDGTPLSFTNWCTRQPDNTANEDFVEIWIDGANNGCWNDNQETTGGGQNGADNDKYVVEFKCVPQGKDGDVFMDPHFKTWTGKQFDYMGECDLVFLRAPHFEPDMELEVDIRTKIRYDYSYIESAVVKIGEETLEVASFGDYYLNSVSGADMPGVISGFPVTHTKKSDHIHLFEIELGEDEKIVISTYKDMVSVKFHETHANRFKDSQGMLGDWETGSMLARNGTALVEDPNLFADEWQVRQDEPMLFLAKRAPQHPEACQLPDPQKSTSRRLGESTVSLEAAKKVCANWDDDIRANCIHDVMATGDLELAQAGAF